MTSAVSVAMATFNGEQFLVAQLESIAAQAVAPYELVICDDCSTDATVELIEDFAGRAPFRVRLERNPERLGFAENSLMAARLCEGDVVAFSDQDDVWHETKIMRCLQAFDSPRCSLVMHNVTPVDADLDPSRIRSFRAAYAGTELHAPDRSILGLCR